MRSSPHAPPGPVPRRIANGVERSRDAHAVDLRELFARLDSRPSGLMEQDAAARLAAVGPNRLETAKPISPLHVLVDQFRSVVVLLLVAAVGVSVAMGDRLEAIAIACVLIINAAIGFATEFQARRAIASLMQLQTASAGVLRDGQLRLCEAAELVPGDVFELAAGQRVPADGRIVSAHDLRIDEAVLTGESLPVDKRDERLPLDTQLADRTNSVLMGTIAVAGTARVLITDTGSRTELGRLGLLMRGIPEERTPLERRLDALGRRLVWLTLAIAAIVIALGWRRGAPLDTVLNTGIALAVAAVPESLPAVATIALAVGVQRMARRRALVRRLPAVEALGSTTVVCTDKTRTLTSGEMQVVHVWTPLGEHRPEERLGPGAPAAVRHALSVAACASREQSGRGERGIGDPVDAAMLSAASAVAVVEHAPDAAAAIGSWIPFSSSRAFSASFRSSGGRILAAMKGAPRRVLEQCDRSSDGRVLDDAARQALLAVNEDLARSGLRVLGLAEGEVSSTEESSLQHLVFVGFVGLMDPPADGVADTIRRLHAAGLRTIMLTGDQRLTAEAVGRALGLRVDAASVDGRELDRMTPADLRERVAHVTVFSRVVPEHKLAIVDALQARGETVAMLGDGVNDAAALKKADVGVAMGRRGTDVAKEAAAIVLQDDRFETISVAVEEGRIVFDNIRKFVFYLFSCNVGEVLVVLIAGLLGTANPLQPLQLLWLNLITDTFPALALAMEPGDAEVMTRPPRDPREAVLSRQFLLEVLAYGGLIAAVTLVAFLRVLAVHPEAAQTAAFTTLALSQVFHLGNARSQAPVLDVRRAVANPYAVGAVVLSIALQMTASTWPPLATTLHVAQLSATEWGLVAVLSIVPGLVGQLRRVLRRRGY